MQHIDARFYLFIILFLAWVMMMMMMICNISQVRAMHSHPSLHNQSAHVTLYIR